MRAGFIGACGAVALWLAIAAASADDARLALAGYQEFSFGMAETDLRKRVKLRKEEVDSRGRGLWLYSTEEAVVNGDAYLLTFLTKDQKLQQVNLVHKRAGDRRMCQTKFREMMGLVQAKYGAPDGEPSVTDNQIGYIGGSRFTFQDGGVIAVSVSWITSADCTQNVAYMAGKGGASF